MKNGLTLVILAAGIGKRFWPVSSDKTLFPFMNRPFLDYWLGEKIPAGISRIVVVANRQNVRDFEKYRFGVPHTVVVQEKADGMAGAVLAAGADIKGAPVLIVIGDHYVEPELLAAIIRRQESGGSAFGIMAGWKSPGYFPGGYLKLGEAGKIEAIIEKPGVGNTPSPFVNVSGHFFRSADDLLQAITDTPESSRDDRYEQAVSGLCRTREILMEPYSGPSVSLKYPWDILDITGMLLGKIRSGRGKNVTVRDSAVIEGEVYLGDNVRVFEFAKIVGPCYIGAGSVIGNSCLVRESILEGGVVTGFNTDITRSYIGQGVWFHRNYVGDSVILPGVSLGSGATTANLRLDDGPVKSVVQGEKYGTGRSKLGSVIGRDSRIGVNVSLMPGVKIGAGTYVSSGLVVDRDLPDRMFAGGKTELVLKPNANSGRPAAGRDDFLKRI